MLKKLTAALICALLALTPTLAEGGAILDGRWLCADIQGNVTEDTRVELRDDFGLFVNRDWIIHAVIPGGKASTGAFEDSMRTLRDRQIALLHDGSLTGHDAELVHTLYALASDWDYRNAQGIEPARPVMEALLGIKSLEDLTGYLCDRENLMRFYPLSMRVVVDYTDSEFYISRIGPPDLMLRDSAEYAERTQAGELYFSLNQRLGMFMLRRLGFSEEEAAGVVEKAFAFETLMAEHIRPNSAQYEADYRASLLNYYSPDELEALAGNFPILDMIRAYGLKPGKRYIVTEPDYIVALSGFYTEENVPLMRDWMLLQAATDMAGWLDQDTARQAKAIRNAVFGVTGVTSDDDNALDTVLELLPVPMDNLYIQAYCTERQREDILGIIDEILDAYREMLNACDWLSEETRERAIEKLDSIRVYAVYPDELGDWSDLSIRGPEEGGSLLQAHAAATDYTISLVSERVDAPVDRNKWSQLSMPTAQVNAYYSTQRTSINIMAGILTGSFYDDGMTYEQMLGGIGFIIAHEVSHAFDTDGAQFDKDGALSNWWTEEDYAAFRERAARLAAWYDGFIPAEGISISGQQVQGEAIADMAAMKCMLAVAARHEGFDYDAFFRHFAATWRCQMVPGSIAAQVAGDIHPMRYLRINATLAQFDEFVDYYGIQPGDGMYIAPENRVAVW